MYSGLTHYILKHPKKGFLCAIQPDDGARFCYAYTWDIQDAAKFSPTGSDVICSNLRSLLRIQVQKSQNGGWYKVDQTK